MPSTDFSKQILERIVCGGKIQTNFAHHFSKHISNKTNHVPYYLKRTCLCYKTEAALCYWQKLESYRIYEQVNRKIIQLITDTGSGNNWISTAQVIWQGYTRWYINTWNNIASLSTCILEIPVNTGNRIPRMYVLLYGDVTILLQVSSTITTL